MSGGQKQTLHKCFTAKTPRLDYLLLTAKGLGLRWPSCAHNQMLR
jgi:hypothetical protein